MIYEKRYKNLIISIIITFYALMLNLSIFHFSDIFITLDDYDIKALNSLVNFPSPFYIELLSMNAIIPEEEMLTISNSTLERFTYFQRYSHNTDYSIIFSYYKVKMFVYKLMTALNNRHNTSTSSAIPLGGHAPPVLLINSNYNY